MVFFLWTYYNKPTQQGFYELQAIAEAENIPIVVYNVPGRTASNIEAKTMLRLAEIPNIVAVKEASGNWGRSWIFFGIVHLTSAYSPVMTISLWPLCALVATVLFRSCRMRRPA